MQCLDSNPIPSVGTKKRSMQKPSEKNTLQLPRDCSESLAKLYKLYGKGGVAADRFGRRRALPSEISRQLSARKRLPSSSQT
jgi:hypothetical protein